MVCRYACDLLSLRSAFTGRIRLDADNVGRVAEGDGEDQVEDDGEAVSASHSHYGVAATGYSRATGGIALIEGQRAVRGFPRSSVQEGVRVLCVALQGWSRAGVERLRDLEPLSGIRARKYRD